MTATPNAFAIHKYGEQEHAIVFNSTLRSIKTNVCKVKMYVLGKTCFII